MLLRSSELDFTSIAPLMRQVIASPPALLFLVHRVPFPLDKGDRIRSFHVLKYLSQFADIDVATLADESVTQATHDALLQYCSKLMIAPLRFTRWLGALGSFLTGGAITGGAFKSAALRQMIRSRWAERTEPYHAVLASASSMASYLKMPELRNVPAVVDLMDVDSQKWADYAEASRGPKSWLYRAEGRRVRRLEQQLATSCRALTLVSEPEANLCRSICPQGNIVAIPNGVDLEYFRPDDVAETLPQHKCKPHQPDAPARTERVVASSETMPQLAETPSCVFVGALDYRPNVEGVQWFCRTVWPGVRKQVPEARCRLVGRSPTPAVTQLSEIDGVDVIGPVADVRPYVHAAGAVIAPLKIARGVQNKVLEAMALAKPVVSSPQALVGIDANPGEQVLMATTPDDWRLQLVPLLRDPSAGVELGRAARRFVETHRHWDHCLAEFARLLGLSRECESPTVIRQHLTQSRRGRREETAK